MTEARILIVDDHEIFRGGLRYLLRDRLESAEVLEAGTLDEALARMSEDPAPRLVLLDLRLPGVENTEAIAALKEGWPETPVLVVSGSEDRDDALACLAAGANGFAPKSLSADEMIAAARYVLAGGVYAPALLLRHGAQPRGHAGDHARPSGRLTQRQSDVLDALLTGASTKDICRRLDLAEGTVKIHLAGLYRALGVRTRAEAIAKVKASGRPPS
jgi:DNA-binding NarL/FixJ family response regulator